MKYRPDIDGLRAVSVLAVMAFHVGIALTPGGFVGVDVFFVISGFLICSVIQGDLDAGAFTVAGFYERRIRRIFPALFFVLGVTILACALLLYPASFTNFAQSLLAATFSVSNFYFRYTSGYFTDLSAARPLLHTWSLAVEEQFYLVFPLAIAALNAWGRRPKLWALAGLALASLGFSAVSAYVDPVAAFYLPQSRAWELLLGALLAQGALPPIKARWINETLGVAGLALILGSVLFLNGGVPFPGLAALPACVGAALIIASGSGGATLVARMLSLKPAVAIGLISYSLYLWHWPVIVLLRDIANTSALSRVQEAGAIIVSLALAYLSWRFVERPLRRAPASRPIVFAFAGGAGAVAASVAAAILLLGGLPMRFSPAVAAVSAYAGYNPRDDFRQGVCFITSTETFRDFDPRTCLRAAADKQNVLLIGDSHAAQFWRALSRTLPEVNVMQATVSGCTPGLSPPDAAPPRCGAMLSYVFGFYLQRQHVDGVIISGAWSAPDLKRLGPVLNWARRHGTPALLLGPSIEYDAALPTLLARQLQSGDDGLALRHRARGARELDAHMRTLAETYGVAYASIYEIECPHDRCRDYVSGGAPLLFDRDHLTAPASFEVLAALRRDGAFSRWTTPGSRGKAPPTALRADAAMPTPAAARGPDPRSP